MAKKKKGRLVGIFLFCFFLFFVRVENNYKMTQRLQGYYQLDMQLSVSLKRHGHICRASQPPIVFVFHKPCCLLTFALRFGKAEICCEWYPLAAWNWDAGLCPFCRLLLSFWRNSFSLFVFFPHFLGGTLLKKSLGSAIKHRVGRVTRNRQFFFLALESTQDTSCMTTFWLAWGGKTRLALEQCHIVWRRGVGII